MTNPRATELGPAETSTPFKFNNVKSQSESTQWQSMEPRYYRVAYWLEFGRNLVGIFLGRVLGALMGIDKNVGGVGIAMLSLIFVTDRMQKRGSIPAISQQGIVFWSLIYIPIVVAMAASQNVVAAVSGGPLALVAAVLVVAICFALVPLLNRRGPDGPQDDFVEIAINAELTKEQDQQ